MNYIHLTELNKLSIVLSKLSKDHSDSLDNIHYKNRYLHIAYIIIDHLTKEGN